MPSAEATSAVTRTSNFSSTRSSTIETGRAVAIFGSGDPSAVSIAAVIAPRSQATKPSCDPTSNASVRIGSTKAVDQRSDVRFRRCPRRARGAGRAATPTSAPKRRASSVRRAARAGRAAPATNGAAPGSHGAMMRGSPSVTGRTHVEDGFDLGVADMTLG
jgi:hypothetical protein